MENFDIKNEKNQHPYKYFGGRATTYNYDGIDYLLMSRIEYVIDAYRKDGGIDLSHYNDLNFYDVVDFNAPENTDTLDLTWMEPCDSFRFRDARKVKNIKTVIVNIENLASSSLYFFNDIKLIVKKGDLKNNTINVIKWFENFIQNNTEIIKKGIKFEDFNPIFELILTKYAEKHYVDVIEEEPKQKINRF